MAFRSGYASPREQLAQGTGELTLGGRRGGRGGRSDGGVAGLDDGVEGGLLVLGVTLDGLDQVGDQIVPALELHVDLRPGVLDLVAPADQAVVRRDQVDDHQQDDDDDHDGEPHSGASVPVVYGMALELSLE